MLAVRISVKQGSVLEAMGKLALSIGDKAGLLNQIGIEVSENTRLRFLDGVAPDGTPWEPSIRAKTQGGETLRDTGRLMNSITHLVSGDHVEVGTNVPYAYPLHFGAEIKPTAGKYLTFQVAGRWARKTSVTLPARPILGITDEDEVSITGVISAFLNEVQK